MQMLLKDVSMHIAALNPKYVSHDQVAQEEIEHERRSINSEIT